MRAGVYGRAVESSLPYAASINQAGDLQDISPLLAYAIAWRESIRGEVAGLWPSAATVESADGGKGLFQLTSWFPPGVDEEGVPIWQQPDVNANAAARVWLAPDFSYFSTIYRLVGDYLIAAVAASFNAGRGAASFALDTGASLDSVTTGGDYATDVVRQYHLLLQGEHPA